MASTSFLELSGGRRIAYHLSEGQEPCVIFMGGFKSDMTGSKALALEAHCRALGQRFLRFDYTGHGESSGEFKDGTIGAWKQDALDVLDKLGSKHNLLVGSSMGAWISLLVAISRLKKIVGLVGVASAPDFTEALIWDKLNSEQKRALEREGVFYAPSCYGEEPYPITKNLIEEGRRHVLLNTPIPVTIPVRLLHGDRDEDVPWQVSVSLMESLSSTDVTLTLVKGGGHRMSDPPHLELLCKTVEELLDSLHLASPGN